MQTELKNSTRGLVPERLQLLKTVIEDDLQQRRYLGAVIAVARHGHVGLFEAMGYADPEAMRPLEKDTVFTIFSITKAFTNALVFRAVERGELALTTKVSSVIPEFGGGRRADITIHHLLTHSSGLPSLFTPKAGMYIDHLDEVIAAICANVNCEWLPGECVTYSPLLSHALMGEAVRRTDPKRRSFRQLIEEEIFQPLGMKDTAMGVRRDLRSRHIPPYFINPIAMSHLGHSNLGQHGAFEEENAEMPWVGAISTAPDLVRFAEMLRRGGELDGVRLLSPTLLDRATQNQTGARRKRRNQQALARGWEEPLTANLGLGFTLRGEGVFHHQFGTLASPRTFGNYGLGSTIFWVEPQLDMTFVCLTTGVIDEGDNTERFQRLSDLAISAAE